MKIRLNNSLGFSLVELSIVIVIIGLLVAGVSAGRGLIESATTRAYISDITSYQTAVAGFKSEYDFLPGDFASGPILWDTTAPGDPDVGNGDGIIGHECFVPGQGCNCTSESAIAWAHLGHSGHINKVYDVINHTPLAGIHIAKGRDNNTIAIVKDYFNIIDPGHYIFITNQMPVSGYRSCPAHGSGLPPIKAQAFDLKIDDGQPLSGNVQAYTGRGLGEAFATDPCTITGEYNLASTEVNCVVGTKLQAQSD